MRDLIAMRCDDRAAHVRVGSRYLSSRQGQPLERGSGRRIWSRTRVKSGVDWIKVFGSRGSFEVVDGTQTVTFDEMKSRRRRRARARQEGGDPFLRRRPACSDAVRAGADSVEHGADVDDETLRRDGEARHGVGAHRRSQPLLHRCRRRITASRRDRTCALKDYIERNLESVRTRRQGRREDRDGVRRGLHDVRPEHQRTRAGSSKAGMTQRRKRWAAATTTPAALLGMNDRLGQVAPGFLADLVAVEGDPLADINVMSKGVKWVTERRQSGRRSEIAPPRGQTVGFDAGPACTPIPAGRVVASKMERCSRPTEAEEVGFGSLGLSAPLSRRRHSPRLRRAHTHSTRGHPRVARRPGRARPGRDRHRQDRGVRAADPGTLPIETGRGDSRGALVLRPRGSWRCRSPRHSAGWGGAPHTMVVTLCGGPPIPRARGALGHGVESWSARPAACSITYPRALDARAFAMLVLDEADGCSRWASLRISRPSSRRHPRRARPRCFRPPMPGPGSPRLDSQALHAANPQRITVPEIKSRACYMTVSQVRQIYYEVGQGADEFESARRACWISKCPVVGDYLLPHPRARLTRWARAADGAGLPGPERYTAGWADAA